MKALILAGLISFSAIFPASASCREEQLLRTSLSHNYAAMAELKGVDTSADSREQLEANVEALRYYQYHVRQALRNLMAANACSPSADNVRTIQSYHRILLNAEIMQQKLIDRLNGI